MYKQTYYGISEILNPLVRGKHVCVLPMEKPITGKAWVLEICPASTLKVEGLYARYKDRNLNDDRSSVRAKILKRIKRIGPLKVKSKRLHKIILEDRNGDALDSVIAAMATFRAIKIMTSCTIEGYVYV